MNLLRRLFTLDLRALALFRIAVGSCVLYDLATRIPQFAEHYTDTGVLPVALAYEMAGRVGRLYLPIWASTSDLWVASMFALLLASAIALVLGYRTRIASILCWLLVVSLQVRNPLVASFGGDAVLRVLLFWAMLLPLGEWYSLDALRKRRRAEPERARRVFSVPAAALVLQMTLLYVTTGFAKYGTTWASGTALYYALHCDYFGNAMGVWLRDQPALLAPLSFAALWFERYGPILLFVPVATEVFRMAACVLFIGLHLGLALFMDVGPFPLYTMAAWPAFLPSSLFDRWLPGLLGGARLAEESSTAAVIGQPAWLQLLAAGGLVFVVAHVSATGMGWATTRRHLPWLIATPGKLLQLQQNWDMFGPDPPRTDIWPILIGEYADGSRSNLLSGGAPELRKPDDMTAAVGSFRSRLYFRALYWTEAPLPIERLHREYARFACGRAAAAPGEGPRLQTVDFHIGRETTREPGPHPVTFERLGRVTCPR